MIKKKKKMGTRLQWAVSAVLVLFVFVCYQNMTVTGKTPALKQIGRYMQEKTAFCAWKNCMPVLLKDQEEAQDKGSVILYVMEELSNLFPITSYAQTLADYDTQIESELSYEMAAAAEGKEETKKQKEAKKQKQSMEEENKKAAEKKQVQKKEEETPPKETEAAAEAVNKAVEVPIEKLADFDYLLHTFYQVDRTTTIDSSQLNPDALLGKSMKVNGGNDSPQILIYHTHSQEGYTDSIQGDPSTTVVGVGERLTALLRDSYGFNVLHHTGEYDVKDRDNAYSYAGPALEQLLAENPSIEVVIDLHRDGVGENTRLVSEVNGKQTAQVMFFNGLSRTTTNGNLTNLPNQYIADNLAFSFQMKLAAEEYYPGFTRSIYLKGYRYNMHYCPKSILVEVGAQTNTLEEAMNAMEPLADLLHKVLTQ